MIADRQRKSNFIHRPLRFHSFEQCSHFVCVRARVCSCVRALWSALLDWLCLWTQGGSLQVYLFCEMFPQPVGFSSLDPQEHGPNAFLPTAHCTTACRGEGSVVKLEEFGPPMFQKMNQCQVCLGFLHTARERTTASVLQI